MMQQEHYKFSYKIGKHQITALAVYNVGVQRCEAGYRWGPGVRDHYLIHCVIAGCGAYTVGGRNYRVRQGDLFLCRPNEQVEYRADESDPWEYCWVGFQGPDAHALLSRTDFTADMPVIHLPDEQAQALIMSIFDSRGTRADELVVMTGKLYIFLGFLLGQAKRSIDAGSTAGEYVDAAFRFVASNYSGPLTVDSLARHIGLSRSRLYRVFMEETGMSPAQYVTRYRMQQAAALLQNKQLSIKTVAYSVGYDDPLYFSRLFHQVVGCSPTSYRENSWTENMV